MNSVSKHLFLLLFFFSSITLALAQKDTNTITVLTYNIYHGEDPANRGTSNLDEIAALILQYSPDVVAMQEVDSMTTRTAGVYGKKVDLVQELAKLTGYSGYFAKAMDYAEGGYGEGLLVKGEAIFSTQNLPIPHGGEPRAAAWAEFQLSNDKKIAFAGTHFCHEFEENRIAQVKEISKVADQSNLPVIWAGDLNLRPDSEAYRSIIGTWKDAGSDPTPYSPTFGSLKDGPRIDYVWFDPSKFTLESYQVLDVPFSDHYPVLVTLKFK